MGLTAKILGRERPRQYVDFLRNYSKGARLESPPIFIVGCGHSGTSLLLKILGAHSHIHAIPYESRAFLKSVWKIRMARLFWYKNAVAAGKRRWAEKTPAHVHAIGRILEIYPDARILLIVRDGRDVAVSLRRRTGNFAAGVARWVRDNRAAEPYWNHPQVFRFTYEALVGDFEATMARVCEFIGEPYEEAMRNFHERPLDPSSPKTAAPPPTGAGRHHAQLRKWQISQALFNGSGKWQEGMSAEEKALFKQKAGQMLIDYGYAEDLNW